MMWYSTNITDTHCSIVHNVIFVKYLVPYTTKAPITGS